MAADDAQVQQVGGEATVGPRPIPPEFPPPTITAWTRSHGVSGPRLEAEMQAWLDFWRADAAWCEAVVASKQPPPAASEENR